MNKSFVLGFLSCACLGMFSSSASAAVGHHGGVIVKCTSPIFFEESPPKDAKVVSFDQFSFTASDNTDPETLKAWINTQPVDISVTPQRSGHYKVEGKLAQPITQGRVWIKAQGLSQDGCDQLHNWNVYVGQ